MVALVAVVMILGTVSQAMAVPPSDSDKVKQRSSGHTKGPAMVVKFNEDDQLVCPFIDSNLVIVNVLLTNAIIVETNSKNGNIKFVCHAEDIFNDTGAEVVWNFDNTGLVLGGFGTDTEKWEITISEDGNAVIHALFEN